MHFMEHLGKKLVWLSNVIFSTQDNCKNCEVLRKMMPEGMSTALSNI